MGRKNDRVRRANARRDYISREKVRRPDPRIERIRLEDLVMPDGQCNFQTRKPKARFATKQKAEAALKQAQLNRRREGTTRVEKRVYQCPEGGCGGWHLTSREAFDEDIRKLRRQQFEQKRGEA